MTLEFSDQEFKPIMINRLTDLMDKVYRIREQMGDVSREMEILKKNKKEMLEIKNIMTEIKNAFGGLE